MTREETLRLLQFLKGCYPNTKIDDPKGTVEAWQLAFSADQADTIYKAARYHMVNNKFFPTPADIQNCVFRASLVYDEAQSDQIADDTTTKALPPQTADKDPDMSELWQWLWSDD